MSRWEPDARGRLTQAAMELFRERGFDRTTVQDIANHAGLTERTFFRYFTDKREVLFWGAQFLQDALVEGVASAPAKWAPLEAVAASLFAISPSFEERREFSRQRHALLTAHAELQERELIKLAKLSAAIAEALRKRGVKEPAASLAAETGMTILKVGFEQWATDTKERELAHHMKKALAALEIVIAGKPRKL